MLDLALLALLAPFIVPLALWAALSVFLFMGRPILFRQQRPGLGEKPFLLCKFRTMKDCLGPDNQPLPDGARLTRFGGFLRRTSLDELPELFQVLKGEMSLVGPRPLLLQYLPLYTPEQRRRHEAKPGITGWAQVNGRNALEWEDKFALDVWYVDHCSLMLDLRILVLTAITVFRREGISQQGHATMEVFRGSLPKEKK